MADTATPNLDLLYLQVGAPNREICVNDGLRVLDTITAATLTIDVSGSGDYVLSDGVTGEAKYGRLKLTGTLTGARAIIVPQLGRQYLVFNGTSGAFALTVKPPTGLSETIDPSTWALLVCDGTDVFRPLTGGGGGGGSVPGGSAGQVQYNNGAGAFAGSSGLVLSATQVTSIDLASPLAVSEGGTGAVTAGQARENLGLTIGSTVQGYDATLAALAGLSTSANQLAYFTGVDAAALTPLSTFMRTLLDDADATAGRATLEIVAASETQAGLVELATPAETTTGTDTQRAVTPAGLAAKVPSGTALSVARYAASGTALETAPGIGSTANPGQLVLGDNLSGASIGTLLVAERQGGLALRAVMTGVTGGTNSPVLQLGAGRGTQAAPQALQGSDPLGHLSFIGYQGSAWSSNMITIQAFTEETWSPTTLGCSLRLSTTLVGTSSRAERLRIDGQGSLTTWDGGKTGLGTPLTAALGSGATYQALNVKGSTLYVAQSSVQERAVAALTATLPVPTDATRTGRLTVSAYDAVGAREGLRVEADGTAARLSFFGQTAVVRQTAAAAATDAGTTQTLANSLRTALVNLGLCV